MTVISVELEEDVAVDLKRTAESLQTDESDVIRKAINNYLRQLKMAQLRARMRPHFEAAGFKSEDDIYTEVS